MKTSKRVLTVLLVGLALAGFGNWAWAKVSALVGVPSVAPGVSETSEASGADVIVTYYTTDVRCETCQEIEDLTRRTVEDRFAEAHAAGFLAFRMINIDRPEHAALAEAFEIAFKTVVVSGGERQGDNERIADWAKMDDVWAYFTEPERFFAYLGEEIETRLDAASR